MKVGNEEGMRSVIQYLRGFADIDNLQFEQIKQEEVSDDDESSSLT